MKRNNLHTNKGVLKKIFISTNIRLYIYNPQNRLFVIPKRNVSVLRPFSKTKRLFLKQNQTAFKWASNPI